MRNGTMIERQIGLFALVVMLFASCGLPVGILTYKKQSNETVQDSTRVYLEESKCLCVDYRFNFVCDKINRTTVDTVSGFPIEVYKFRGSDFDQRDGRQKRKTRTLELDSGIVVLKTKLHYQTYGRRGRERLFKEVDYRVIGFRKQKTIRRGTKRRKNKVEKVVKR